MKWSIELSEFDVQYQARNSLKSQALADFVVELSAPETSTSELQWTLHVDGASNPQGSGAGIILSDGKTYTLEQSIRFCFSASNNQSE
ncbi:MAG: hypothetical protein Q8879_00115, partial [Candidatus Phytoplasma australasiaticum]|nr:hypothetical protein [Candidatus Phytoplasma australasiaticum]